MRPFDVGLTVLAPAVVAAHSGGGHVHYAVDSVLGVLVGVVAVVGYLLVLRYRSESPTTESDRRDRRDRSRRLDDRRSDP